MLFNFIKSSYNKVKNALFKTRSFLGNKISSLFSKKIDAETLEQLEELLYQADLGVKTATEMTQKIRLAYAKQPNLTPDGILNLLKSEMIKELSLQSDKLNVPADAPPMVILVVGVNGNGKTTSVAKLAKKFIDENQGVLVAAADTFRAAAVEQLETWATRIGVDIVKGKHGSDPSAVVYDAVSAAIARKKDIVIIDTAGRLHTKIDLMQELEKIKRSCQKLVKNAPHEILLVLDATTGQNAIDQAKIFNKYTPITGIILTKLDGTAKGGIVMAIQKELQVPIKFIGVGEGMDDLEPFDANNFINALFD